MTRSLSGNQPKYYDSSTRSWVKQDMFGGEAYAEFAYATIAAHLGIDTVRYRLLSPIVGSSKSFIQPPEVYIPMSNLFKQCVHLFPTSPDQLESYINTNSKSVKFRWQSVFTCLDYIGIPKDKYIPHLVSMSLLDSYTHNLDRHLNNFGVIYNPSINTYRLAPLFDAGISLGVPFTSHYSNKTFLLPLSGMPSPSWRTPSHRLTSYLKSVIPASHPIWTGIRDTLQVVAPHLLKYIVPGSF